MTDGLSAWAILVIILAVVGVTYVAVDLLAHYLKKGSAEQYRRRYYKEHMSCVKINEHDYVDVHRITGFSVFLTSTPDFPHLYVILDSDPVTNRYYVGDFYLGNIIDYLYRVLDMEAEDYGELDNWYDRAVDYARKSTKTVEDEDAN